MSAAGAFGGQVGVELLPVGLTVLVDEADLRLGRELRGEHVRRGRRRRGVVAMVVRILRLLVRGRVRGSEGLYYLPVQDAEGHPSHGVFEVVLRGQAVVQPTVCVAQGLQQNTVARLQHFTISVQQFPSTIFLVEPLD